MVVFSVSGGATVGPSSGIHASLLAGAYAGGRGSPDDGAEVQGSHHRSIASAGCLVLPRVDVTFVAEKLVLTKFPGQPLPPPVVTNRPGQTMRENCGKLAADSEGWRRLCPQVSYPRTRNPWNPLTLRTPRTHRTHRAHRPHRPNRTLNAPTPQPPQPLGVL